MLNAIVLGISVLSSGVNYTEQQCLALNIYHEARGEYETGMIAVAEVTMNRVKSDKFPDTICEVVYQPGAFSWVGAIDQAPNLNNTIDRESWKKANTIAVSTMMLSLSNYTKGATFYHANYVRPYWVDHFDKVAVIGNHVFYKQ